MIAIHGNRGSAVIEQDDILKWDFNPSSPDDDEIRRRFAAKSGASGGASNPAAISHGGHMLQLSDFVEAIRADRPPSIDGREGRKSVAAICAIYESVRAGKPVRISETGS
jgi:predicted dehydrogenase